MHVFSTAQHLEIAGMAKICRIVGAAVRRVQNQRGTAGLRGYELHGFMVAQRQRAFAAAKALSIAPLWRCIAPAGEAGEHAGSATEVSAAVDVHHLPGHKTRLLAGQPGHHVGHLLRLSLAAEQGVVALVVLRR